ncbi:hypothetical protein AAHB50_32115 [Bacillus toyonensis]
MKSKRKLKGPIQGNGGNNDAREIQELRFVGSVVRTVGDVINGFRP